MREVQPILKVLTRDQIDSIHHYSLEILSRVGIRLESLRARKLFAKATGVADKNESVRIPAELVEWALGVAPSTVNIFDRCGNLRFQLGKSRRSKTRFGIGVTNLYY
jgi:trimethylamine--corrinoid protein Co-methyltransferase